MITMFTDHNENMYKDVMSLLNWVQITCVHTLINIIDVIDPYFRQDIFPANIFPAFYVDLS